MTYCTGRPGASNPFQERRSPNGRGRAMDGINHAPTRLSGGHRGINHDNRRTSQ